MRSGIEHDLVLLDEATDTATSATLGTVFNSYFKNQSCSRTILVKIRT